MIKVVEGNLILYGLEGKVGAVAHGANCVQRMKKGIAPQMAEVFGVDKYPMEIERRWYANRNKLGMIEGQNRTGKVMAFNFYTQFMYATEENPKPFELWALNHCLQAYEKDFSHLSLGIPKIGSGLGGHLWNEIRELIEQFNHLDITIVEYKK